MKVNMNKTATVGSLLRDWRQRRRLSQLALACDAQISTRHLSFVETGRARPSRELLLQLGEQLELPLRERNKLLLAGGYAPCFAEHAWSDEQLAAAREAVQRVLSAHDPYPALAIDGHWNLLQSNAMAQRLLSGVAPELLIPPINVLRISLHPQGLAPAIVNLGSWRGHLLDRLRRQVQHSGDPLLTVLLDELSAYPRLPGEIAGPATGYSLAQDVVALLHLRTAVGELALFSTLTTFGTPQDITLSEVALEAFYPADAVTAERLRELAREGSG
jgi:transcriptional regulator with XRE-family HTH domain